MAVNEKQGSSTLTNDARSEKYARGAAGQETGAREGAVTGEHEGTLEDRRETQQVITPSTDGVGEGLVKDAS
jgi:hypothetical protein